MHISRYIQQWYLKAVFYEIKFVIIIFFLYIYIGNELLTTMKILYNMIYRVVETLFCLVTIS